MAPGASRRIRRAWQAALAAVLSMLAIYLAHTLPAGTVSAATPPDLTVTKTDSADPVEAGHKYSYTITISNIGGSTAGTEIDPQTNGPVGVFVDDLLPMGFVPNSFSASGDGVCQLTTTPYRLDCRFGPMAPGQVETVTVSGAVTPGGGPSVLNRAIVDLPVSRTSEAIEVFNNIADATTEIIQPTATPTVTATPTATATVTSTPTRTLVPPELGGVAGYPDASSGANAWLIAGVVGAAGLILFGASWWARRRAG